MDVADAVHPRHVEARTVGAEQPPVGGILVSLRPARRGTLVQRDLLAVAALPRNVAVQIYRALLENQAGFYGSQMTAMDNATRNAGDMINRLSIQYNRQRQAAITTELVEIISGAEAL